MKKHLFFCIALFLSANTIFAQGGFRLGVKGGANLSQISGQPTSEGFNVGYQAGGFVEIDFSKTLGIQPEVLFSQTKLHSSTSGIYNGFDSVNLNYLSIPILLRISAGKLITFVVGPQYSMIVKHNETGLQNAGDAFKSGDFAMVGGLQFNLDVLRIYVRYVAGMSNISNISNSSTWTNQQIQAGIGLRIINIHKREKKVAEEQ